MPEETFTPENLHLIGPMLKVQVSISNALMDIYLRNGILVPSPISLNGLIDTGATYSLIKEGKIDGLKLNPVGVQQVIGVGDIKATMYPMYRIGLSIFGVEYYDTTVTVTPLHLTYNTECLIGRDILRHCIFEYNGPGGSFTIKG